MKLKKLNEIDDTLAWLIWDWSTSEGWIPAQLEYQGAATRFIDEFIEWLENEERKARGEE